MNTIFSFVERFISSVYTLIFARKELARFNKLLFLLSLHGLGVDHEGKGKLSLSGEEAFLRRLAKALDEPIIFDVGANVGDYSGMARAIWPDAMIYAFEPHPKTFVRLEAEASKRGYAAFNLGCGDKKESLQLYDYEDDAEGGRHASLYRAVIEDFHGAKSRSYAVDVTTIDDFVVENEIPRIHLLKIDTEGNEMKVIEGAKKCVANGMIDVIQFEFNETNLVSRSFFKDFHNALLGYSFYRILPNGLLPLEPYNALMCELFAYQNIVAIRMERSGSVPRV